MIMTSRDIKKLSIITETKDGQYLVTTTKNDVLIDAVVELCKFAFVKPELISSMSLQELVINKLKNK